MYPQRSPSLRLVTMSFSTKGVFGKHCLKDATKLRAFFILKVYFKKITSKIKIILFPFIESGEFFNTLQTCTRTHGFYMLYAFKAPSVKVDRP